jgi:hypothetical protein
MLAFLASDCQGDVGSGVSGSVRRRGLSVNSLCLPDGDEATTVGIQWQAYWSTLESR